MIKTSKFQELCLTLTLKQMKTIRDWGEADAVRMTQIDLEVMDLLILHYNALQKNGFALSYLERIISDDHRFIWHHIRSRISRAITLYHHFHQIRNKPEIEDDYAHLMIYQEKNLKHSFIRQSKLLRKRLDKDTLSDNMRNLYQFLFQERQLYHTSSKDNRKKILELNQWEDSLYLFYVENRLRVLCEKYSRHYFFKHYPLPESSDVDFVNDIKHLVSSTQEGIHFYHAIFLLFHNKNDTLFLEKKNLLLQDKDTSLGDDFKRPLLDYMMNYCLIRRQDGIKDMGRHYVEILQHLMYRNKLTDFGVITRGRFKNIIALSLEQGDVPFAESFLSTYRKRVNNQIKNTVVKYAEGLIFFHKEEYDYVIESIHSMELPSDDFLKVNVDILLMQVFYLQKKYNSFEIKRKGLLQMLKKNNRIGDRIMKSYQDFISYILLAKNARYDNKKDKVQILIQEIKKAKPFHAKAWLLGTLEI